MSTETYVARLDDDAPVRTTGRVLEWLDDGTVRVEWQVPYTEPPRTAVRVEYADDLAPVR